ncbi:MAG: GntR family transcriptional regulator [Thermodesulfobacteriota bacterium]
MKKADNFAERVYRLIKSRIISLEYPPGQKLEIRKLKNETRFSLSPIKMAIQRLWGEGFVKIVPQKGTFVTEVLPNEIAALLDYRLVLERGALYLAFQRMTRAEVGKLRTLQRRMARLTKSGDYFRQMELDSKFHFAIIQAARNQGLMEAYAQLSPHFKLIRFHRALQRGRWSERVDEEHARIVQALEERNYRKLEKTITGHIMRIKKEFCDDLAQDSTPSIARMLKLYKTGAGLEVVP